MTAQHAVFGGGVVLVLLAGLGLYLLAIFRMLGRD